MILEHKRIDLFGKMLFETMVIKPPFKKPNPMPNEACFLYVLEGSYNSTSEIQQLNIEAEESVLMKCGTYLSDMILTKQSDKYIAVAVHFFPEVIQRVYENQVPKFLKEAIPINSGMIKLNSDILIKKYIESLLFYFENPQLVDEEILILKLKEIILLLNKTENAKNIRSILSNLFNPVSYSFREIIEAHYYSSITLDQLALLTRLSVSSFKREFRKLYDAAPATYLRNKRLEKSIELLASTELQITEIAYQCGFSDISHFSRNFKQKYGLSPSAFKLDHFN